MNTSSDNFYKCLFYGILFIFLTIILLLLLKNNKRKKEKYTCTPSITIPTTSSSNIIQVDPSSGDLSEIDTNSILTAVNQIITCFTDTPTFKNANLTDTTLTDTTLSGITNLKGVISGGDITVVNLSCSNLNTTGGINLNSRHISEGNANMLTINDHVVIVTTEGVLYFPTSPNNGQQILIMPLADNIKVIGAGIDGGVSLTRFSGYNFIFILNPSDPSKGMWWLFYGK